MGGIKLQSNKKKANWPIVTIRYFRMDGGFAYYNYPLLSIVP